MWYDKFTALTIVSEENAQYFKLVESARKFGWPLQVFFKPAIQGYEAFMQYKHLYLYQALTTLKNTKGVEQFLFLDGWDTVFVNKPPFKVLHAKKLSFSAENNCYPDERYEVLYPPRSATFRFLNAGVVWGPVSEYLRLCPAEAGFDQLQWHRTYVLHPEEFELDLNGAVAVNLQGIEDTYFTRHPDGVEFTPPNSVNTRPCILHANGKWPMPAWAGK